ncbi:hypothetical protein NLI96_g13095 [Meripilus lineatus]|uniref:Uncharacterized protein n=1 Tax=Meripilus lineatus TaxID=2056292 RepID=A0AAD5UNQ3_9APHY|nr:hypothetical protein NLI96_g13095 [Physisporinus lineatus]
MIAALERVPSAPVTSSPAITELNTRGTDMRLIEPDERRDFLATLKRRGLAEGDFDLQEADTTDPKGDENLGLRGYVTITRFSTQIAKEYVIGDESDWLQHFRKDLEAGAFDRLDN